MDIRFIEADSYTPAPKIGTKKRVAAYARVSTSSEEQQNSYKHQVEYYANYIKKNPDWEFVGVYTDEGVTGTSTKHRDGFQKMIKDAMKGKIDIILAKSISRFARNTIDTLTTIRDLRQKNVSVIFERESIDTLSSENDFLFTLLSSLAQEESRSTSENIKWSIRKTMAHGKVYIPHNMLGFRQNHKTGEIYIVEEEAELIRRIFDLYLSGLNYSAIARQINSEGYINSQCGTKLKGISVKNILINEKYRGDALLQKTYRENYITKKCVENKGKLPQYYVTGSHPAIIDAKKFDQVQEIIRGRSSRIGYRYCSSPFGCKMYCGCCGRFYGPKIRVNPAKGNYKVWACNSRNYKTDNLCPNIIIKNEALEEIFIAAFNIIIKNKKYYTKRIRAQIKECLESAGSEPYKKAKEEYFNAREQFVNYKETHDMESPDSQNIYLQLSNDLSEKKKAFLDSRADRLTPDARSNILKAYLSTITKQRKHMVRFNETVCRNTLASGMIYPDNKYIIEFIDGTRVTVMTN